MSGLARGPLAARAGVVTGFVLVVAAALLAVRGHEHTLATGTTVLAELAPVDPRSLMQGDYMALAYAIDNEIGRRPDSDTPPPRYAWLRLDAAGRASLAGTDDARPAPDSGLIAIRLRTRFGQPTIGPNAFFFQEGTAERFEPARWGEFRVAADGTALLTHLRDGNLERLGEIQR
jgi:uncharacterized membrane-anchored protein